MTRACGQSFIIDQALHGYDGGHRLLAISRKLDSRNKHAALQLSDRSAPTSDLPPSGYLTGYPLYDDGVYVLSRTWAAPEMKRPGCVWTHSLFIAFTDLAQINDTAQLTALFRKPNASQNHTEYAHPLEFESSLGLLDPGMRISLASAIVTALYGKPGEQIFLTVDDQPATEAIVLAIWSQQWPRLRRGFRFCTLTSRDRSTPDHPFDLQLRQSEIKRTSLWPESQQSRPFRDTDPGTWINICLQDLTASRHPLRDFLRRAGSDLTEGRRHFAELCELYGYTSGESDISAIERTLEYVEHRLPSNEGRLLRKATIEDAVRQAASMSDRSLITVLPYLRNRATSFSKDTAAMLAHRYWEIDPNILLAPTTPSEIRHELGPITKDMTLTDAWEIMRRSKKLFQAILKTKPEVLTLPQIWSGETDDALIEQSKRTRAKSLKRRILNAIIAANRRDLAQFAVDWLGSEVLLESLMRGTDDISETGMRFISEALTRSSNTAGTIGKYLVDVNNPLPKGVIHALTGHVQPSDSVGDKERNIDPWATAWTVSTGDLDAHSTDAVHVFFAQRAFSLVGPASASLLSIVFDPLFDRFSRNEVSYDNRARLSHQLDSSGWWDWSYEGRLMRTIVNFAIVTGLSESGSSEPDPKR